MHVLLINAKEALPAGAESILRDFGWSVTSVPDCRTALRATTEVHVDAVIARAPAAPVAGGSGAGRLGTGTADRAADPGAGDFVELLRALQAERTAAVVLAAEGEALNLPADSLIHVVDADIPLPELRGRLATIDRYHSTVCQLERELRNLERISKRLNERFIEVDQEMRLASRLQHDFLPTLARPIGDVQFAALYRPASWVSGDIYDVQRVDEDHVAFYIADAVGHGMAASLLTIFIKRTIATKRIFADRYEIVRPGEALRQLNDTLAEQGLPNCQFVTAWYGLLNIRTLRLAFARGGHPYPLLYTRDGTVREVKSSGGLLGVFGGQEFPEGEIQLRAGDRLVLYTDGAELVFSGADEASGAARRLLEPVATRPIQQAVAHIESLLGDRPEGEGPTDDVSVLGLEVIDA